MQSPADTCYKPNGLLASTRVQKITRTKPLKSKETVGGSQKLHRKDKLKASTLARKEARRAHKASKELLERTNRCYSNKYVDQVDHNQGCWG